MLLVSKRIQKRGHRIDGTMLLTHLYLYRISVIGTSRWGVKFQRVGSEGAASGRMKYYGGL